MARLPRLTVPGLSHHIVQRGNNRQLTFRDTADCEYLLKLLADYSAQEKVAIHSYVLMSNHFHLLATPQTETGLPRMMQAVGRRYVQYFNKRHARTGTLWEGRYKSTLIETDRYLLTCMAYIDLNPVRAGMVNRAADYRWSSHGHYAGLKTDRLVTPHSIYWALGNTPFAREAGYADLVNQGITPERQAELTDAVLRGWVVGDPKFIESIQRATDRRLSRLKPGRTFKQPVPH